MGILPALPDQRSELVDRFGGKPTYHHGNRQLSGRVTSPSSPSLERPLRRELGSPGRGRPTPPSASARAVPPDPADGFVLCSAPGEGRSRPRPARPPSSFLPPQQVCVPSPSPQGRKVRGSPVGASGQILGGLMGGRGTEGFPGPGLNLRPELPALFSGSAPPARLSPRTSGHHAQLRGLAVTPAADPPRVS